MCFCVTERETAEESVICIWMCIYRSFSSVSLVTETVLCSVENGRRMRMNEKLLKFSPIISLAVSSGFYVHFQFALIDNRMETLGTVESLMVHCLN